MRKGFLCSCMIVALLGFGFNMGSKADTVFTTYSFFRAYAMDMASKPFEFSEVHLPNELAQMDYDAFRKIRYVREKGPWYNKNLPFELQFFHMGSIFKNSVKISEIHDRLEYSIPYNSEAFTLDDTPLSIKDDTLDYAGFRLHYPLNNPKYYDELVSFLGASYFRALGKDQKYGISARGLAINTGVATGEEFPFFKKFIIQRPRKNDKKVTIHALLDSQSVAGIYEFVVRPGITTTMDVTMTLYLREDIQKIGIAPLTSMYLFGENTKNKFFDFRPEVHDSDGLSLLDNARAEWLWRPLDNSSTLRMSSFSVEDVAGFGLFQRDRNADHYQDMEAFYEARPSVWVETLEGFEKGRIHLVEIPSDKEIHDNIVAFFWPDEEMKKGTEHTFKYRLNWTKEPTGATLLTLKKATGVIANPAYVADTFAGVGGVSGSSDDGAIKYVVDFKGIVLDAFDRKGFESQNLTADVTASEGKVKHIVLQKNTIQGGYRVVFDYYPNGKTAELRAGLKMNGAPLGELLKLPELNQEYAYPISEIWSYQYLQ